MYEEPAILPQGVEDFKCNCFYFANSTIEERTDQRNAQINFSLITLVNKILAHERFIVFLT